MKKLRYILGFLMVGFGFSSCEDVIDVDLPQSEPRLVVDALIRIPANEEYFPVTVRLTTTAPFNAAEVPTVAGAQVSLSAQSKIYTLNDKGNGVYLGELPKNVIETQEIQLVVVYQEEKYTSSTSMVSTVPVDSLFQGTGTLFSGDETEIIVNYTDPAPSRDFYLFDLDYDFYLLSEDSFYQGNSFSFSYFYEDLKADQSLNIKILGVNKPFYDYMNIVIAQTGQDAAGPFEAPPAEVKGNIINTTNPGNYPLGYFAIAQQYSDTIIIQ